MTGMTDKWEVARLEARRLVARLAGVPGVIPEDCAILVADKADCSLGLARAAVASALAWRQGAEWARLRSALARAGKSPAEVDAAVAYAVGSAIVGRRFERRTGDR